jgi:hypothetical protein
MSDSVGEKRTLQFLLYQWELVFCYGNMQRKAFHLEGKLSKERVTGEGKMGVLGVCVLFLRLLFIS